MYASKRRQRNFKRVREAPKPAAATNPSKRHRERLNGELETVAALLPYDQSVISRLDKLSVLRLAVSYLQIKAHFQACLQRSSYVANFPFAFTHTYPFVQSGSTTPYGGIPSIFHAATGRPLVDPKEHDFETMALKALGGFILILNENGEIYYASENIETYLGFHQSDILHQSLFEMIHSEDREDIKQQLAWNYNIPPHVTCLQDLLTPGGMHYLERNVNARFRCLLDNTCGFLRIDIRGKLMSLHGLPHSFVLGRSDANSSGNTVLGLVAVCSPFVPPNVVDQPVEDPILKTKHSLDFTLISMDSRVRAMLEIEDKHLPRSFYSLVHVDDALCLAEAHKEVIKNSASGLLIYRLISLRSRRTYWIQSSCRMFYKNGKPESIGLTHRLLTEVEGTMLLDKRASLKAKLLSFDDSLLQSPRNLQSTAALPSSAAVAASAVSNIPNTISGLAMKLTNSQSSHSHNIYAPQNISSGRVLQAPVAMISATRSTPQQTSTRGRKKKKQPVEPPNQPFNPQPMPINIMPLEQHEPYEQHQQHILNYYQQHATDEHQQHLIAAAAAACVGAGGITTVPNSDDFSAVACHATPGTSSSAIHGLLQLPQELTTSFPALSAYLTPDGVAPAGLRPETNAYWPSSKTTTYWPTPSDLYYQNYPNSATGYANSFSSAFCSSQPEEGAIIPSTRRVEYPATLPPANSAVVSSPQRPSPQQTQLLSTSGFGHRQLTTLKSPNIFESDSSSTEITLNYDSGTDYKNLLNLSDYTHTMRVNPTNVSAATAGFNLISEVTNTLLG